MLRFSARVQGRGIRVEGLEFRGGLKPKHPSKASVHPTRVSWASEKDSRA